jgi:hypothetical protein
VSAIVSGLIGGLIATGFGMLALRTQKPARTDRDGWKRLRPSWLMHSIVLGCLAFVVLMIYVFAQGGSTRADAEEQNFAALLILLGFGAAGLWIFWFAYLHRIAWKGDTIRCRSPFRRDSFFHFSDVTLVDSNSDFTEYKLVFSDGRKLRVSTYFHGFNDFMQVLDERFGNALQEVDH